MTEDALAAGRLFGMIQPDPHAPVVANGPALYRVGCLGRLCSFSETEDGRYLITLTGVIRFAVAGEQELRRGYRRVRADFSGFAADLDDAVSLSGFDRPTLLAALRGSFSRRGIEANWEAIDGMADEVLVTTLCMACPFEPAEKQALLEAATPADRATALVTLLKIDIHNTGADTAPARSRAS
jgi:Lon protease-like protein